MVYGWFPVDLSDSNKNQNYGPIINIMLNRKYERKGKILMSSLF